MDISIIIPCHNAEQWISKAIQSCLDKKFEPLKIIVVDNGSKDARSAVPPMGRLPYRIAERWLGGETAERLASWKRRMMQSRKAITL